MLIIIILLICSTVLKEKTIYLLTTVKNTKEASICLVPEKNYDEELLFTNDNWKIEIPKINLAANINFGTTKEVMDEFVGHFDETGLWNGNIGLAAHNRGYPVNYFGRLKELKVGDEIKYITTFGTKSYKVVISTIIKDTDWTYLKSTKDNRITLITCVENEPSYRRCIQGIEI